MHEISLEYLVHFRKFKSVLDDQIDAKELYWFFRTISGYLDEISVGILQLKKTNPFFLKRVFGGPPKAERRSA